MRNKTTDAVNRVAIRELFKFVESNLRKQITCVCLQARTIVSRFGSSCNSIEE